MTELQFRKDYEDEKSRKCHECDKVVDIDELVAGVKGESGAVVQGITGRVFCSGECHHDYLVNEGLV